MICVNCGRKIKHDYKICQSCGFLLHHQTKVSWNRSFYPEERNTEIIPSKMTGLVDRIAVGFRLIEMGEKGYDGD